MGEHTCAVGWRAVHSGLSCGPCESSESDSDFSGVRFRFTCLRPRTLEVPVVPFSLSQGYLYVVVLQDVLVVSNIRCC